MSSSNSNENLVDKIIFNLIRDEEDEELELVVDAYSSSFHIQGCAFFSGNTLRDSISKFRNFPIVKDDPPCISGGYFSDEGRTLISEHIRIAVVPIGGVGRLMMRVKAFLPDPEYWKEGFGRGGQFDYRVTYEGLNQFVRKSEQLVGGEISTFEFSDFE